MTVRSHISRVQIHFIAASEFDAKCCNLGHRHAAICKPLLQTPRIRGTTNLSRLQPFSKAFHCRLPVKRDFDAIWGRFAVVDSSQVSVDVLAAMVDIQQQFIATADADQALGQVLNLFVELSDSPLGFVGEALRSPNDELSLEILAMTGADQTNPSEGDNDGPDGKVLDTVKQLMGTVLATREAVVANAPNSDSHSRKSSPTHSAPSAFLALPILDEGGELVGVAGLGNRLGGYDDDLIARLRPLCGTLGYLLSAVRREQRRRSAEGALRASEERYRSYVDQATDGIFLHDNAGRIVDVNRQGSESLGYERDELIGKMPAEFDSQVTPELLVELINRLNAGETVAFEARHRRKDGSTFPVEVRIRPYWVRSERHGLAVVRDITERKQAEQQLRESEERLRLALAASRMGVWEWDTETNAVYWSPECFDIYGIPSFDGRAESFAGHVHPDDVITLGGVVQQTIQKETINAWEYRVVTPNGEERWISNCGVVRRDESTNSIRLIGTARDITYEKLAAEAMRKQYAILNTILESTTDFIYMKDCQGRYVTINAAAAAFIGQRVEEIIGRNDAELFPPEVAREIQARDQQLFATASEQRFEESIPSGNRRLHLFTSKNVCRDSTGNVIGLVGITRDVTAHVEARRCAPTVDVATGERRRAHSVGCVREGSKGQFSSAVVEPGGRIDFWTQAGGNDRMQQLRLLADRASRLLSIR